ncbi:MAG: cytidylate kinase-like family protein [Deltaproteobacteria bacterium]|nr:cytidylate kinase-like family protein [Deltaproteobacteria bacterium]
MPVITIARPFGAGGHTVGRLVAERLGYTLVKEEMVNAVAEKARVSPDWVRSIEKERGNALMNFISGLVSSDFVERLLEDRHGYIDEKIYVDTLSQVMEEIAREGNAVIIGRGGQYLLHDHPNAFHVLLTADDESRVKFLSRHYNLSEAQAKKAVSRGDKRRTNFYKKLKHKDYDDPSLYHMVLNTARVDIDRAVDLICLLARKRA